MPTGAGALLVLLVLVVGHTLSEQNKKQSVGGGGGGAMLTMDIYREQFLCPSVNVIVLMTITQNSDH